MLTWGERAESIEVEAGQDWEVFAVRSVVAWSS